MITLTTLRQAAHDVVDQLTESEVYHLAVTYTMLSTPIQSLTTASLHPAPDTLDLKILASAITRVDSMTDGIRKQSAASELLLSWLGNLNPGTDSGIGVIETP